MVRRRKRRASAMLTQSGIVGKVDFRSGGVWVGGEEEVVDCVGEIEGVAELAVVGTGVVETEEREERGVDVVDIEEEEIVVGMVTRLKILVELVVEFSARRLYRVRKPCPPRKE
jgi:hypothetical protein